MKYSFTKFIFLSLLAISAVAGCKKDNDIKKSNPAPGVSEADSIYIKVDQLMNSVYYWIDHVNQVNWKDYADDKNPNDMMQDMIYTSMDHWSAVYSAEMLDDWMNGEEYGYGFYPSMDGSNQIRAALVYKQTEAYQKGLRRGDKIVTINNVPADQFTGWDILSSNSVGTPLKLSYQREGENTKTISISAQRILVDQILNYQILEAGNKKVGYIAYESFSSSNVDSLIGVMGYFSANNVNELIVDLRYNGGGEIDVLDKWVNTLIPKSNSGDVYFRVAHNKYIASVYDTAYTFAPRANSLELNRVFVIGTENTASASEAFINSLSPYMDVQLVGQKTHGKPVGMYVIPYKDWYLLPIAFEYTNLNNEGGFYNGITPDYLVNDDITKNWSDPTEECTAACLSYIKNGYYSTILASSGLKSQTRPIIPFKQRGLIAKLPHQAH